MRNISKSAPPGILVDNSETWLAEYLACPTNQTAKYRYRHPDIKQALKNESGDKCVYCESKIGHNTPGDIEHKVPSSGDPSMHFEWRNLAIACTECNRRKNAYYNESTPFLDPHNDDVESMIVHHGPLVFWISGNRRAEITLRLLELGNSARSALVLRKIEVIQDFKELLERHGLEDNATLKGLIARRIAEKTDVKAEYSGMLSAILERERSQE